MRYLSIVAAAIALATTASGQQELVGTWQLLEAEPATFTFHFDDDGGFQAVVPAIMFFEDDEDEADEDDFSLAPFFEGAEYLLSGDWEIDEDGLWISTWEAEFLGGEATLEDVLIEAGEFLATEIAEEDEIADEDYEEFEVGIIGFLLSEYSPEALLFAAHEHFDEEVFGSAFSFEVENDILTLTDEFGDASDLRRVTETAVPDLPWGQIKADMR